jgi:ParB family transcriptional regulator, chromosome partitioning protein
VHCTIDIETIDQSLSVLRLTTPEQIASMQNSLKTDGQLQPIVVRKKGIGYQVLDGFKRYYASDALKWKGLQALVVEVDDITAKTMMLSYNRQGSTLLDYEEARIVYSLKNDHLMKQEEIATQLSRSLSWVSRRISLIERLEEIVCTHLQLGKITTTHARELAKLPRGKQPCFLKMVMDNNLSSRQTAKLVSMYLRSVSEKEQAYLMEHPLEAIEKQFMEAEINDCRLSIHGNRLLKTSKILAHQQHIFIGHCTHPPIRELKELEHEILCEGFINILKKTGIIVSILKPYYKKINIRED